MNDETKTSRPQRELNMLVHRHLAEYAAEKDRNRAEHESFAHHQRWIIRLIIGGGGAIILLLVGAML